MGFFSVGEAYRMCFVTFLIQQKVGNVLEIKRGNDYFLLSLNKH